jgi:hypothetical protein
MADLNMIIFLKTALPLIATETADFKLQPEQDTAILRPLPRDCFTLPLHLLWLWFLLNCSVLQIDSNNQLLSYRTPTTGHGSIAGKPKVQWRPRKVAYRLSSRRFPKFRAKLLLPNTAAPYRASGFVV